MSEFVSIDALAIGVNTVDVLVQLPDHYTAGEKLPARDLVIQGGGPAATAACVLASLGWRTGFITHLGDDELSIISRADFKRCGVVDDFFIMDPNASPVAAVIHVNPQTGERTIFYTANRYKFLAASDIPLEIVRRAKLVLVDGYERDAAPTVLDAVRKAGGRSVLDIEGGASERAFRLLQLGTDCILPINVARMLTGEETVERVLHRLAEKTPAQLIVTDGVQGSWALTEDGVLHQPAFAVAAVDTTGCVMPFMAPMEPDSWADWRCVAGWNWPLGSLRKLRSDSGGRSHLPTRDSFKHMDQSVFSPELQKGLMSPQWNSGAAANSPFGSSG